MVSHSFTTKTGVFAKQHASSESARTEYERTVDVYRQVQQAQPRYLRVAKPLGIENNTVYFEHITGCVNLRTLICRWHVELDVLYLVGQALAELHLALNPDLKNLNQRLHIHGDFSAVNVLYHRRNRLIYLVDFARYHLDDSDSYCYGPAYRDLAHLVITLEIKYPMYQLYLVARTQNKRMSRTFWAGYDALIGGKIDYERLKDAVIADIDVAISRARRRNILSRLIWTSVARRVRQQYLDWKAHGYEHE